MKPVASPAGSAARSAEHQAATALHSREQPTPLVHLHGSGQQDQVKQYARFMKQQVNFPPSQFSASRQAAMALGSGSISQFFGPAAFRSAAAFVLLGSRRQATPWCVSLASAERDAPNLVHQSQQHWWHTAHHAATAHCDA